MDLVDALSSNTQAHSVVELSLNPCFRRDYNSLFKGLDEYQYYWAQQNLAKLAGTLSSSSSEKAILVIRRGCHSSFSPLSLS